MLYKVTPMMTPAEAEQPKKARREPGAPRKRRKTAIYDGEGHEVLITLMCLKCKGMKPLAQFGLRKMADGAIRNQPWCRTCRSQAGTKPKKSDIAAEVVAADAATEGSDEPQVTQLEADPVQPAAVVDETTQPRAEQHLEAQPEASDEQPLPVAAEPSPSYQS